MIRFVDDLSICYYLRISTSSVSCVRFWRTGCLAKRSGGFELGVGKGVFAGEIPWFSGCRDDVWIVGKGLSSRTPLDLYKFNDFDTEHCCHIFILSNPPLSQISSSFSFNAYIVFHSNSLCKCLFINGLFVDRMFHIAGLLVFVETKFCLGRNLSWIGCRLSSDYDDLFDSFLNVPDLESGY
jgi:hypothetical protein